MVWNFRALNVKDGVGVYGVYYGQDGTIESRDSEPYVAHEETLSDLVTRLKLLIAELESHGAIDDPFPEAGTLQL